MKRKIILALLIILSLAMLPAFSLAADTESNLYIGEDTEENRFLDLTDEILKPNNRKNQDIFLTGDAKWVTDVNHYTGIQNGYFTIDGGGHTVTVMQNLGVGIGSKVILKNITVDLSGYRFTVRESGCLELGEGARIINGNNAVSGCISIEGNSESTFKMDEGSEIKDCGKSSQVASAVYIHGAGSFIFRGGVIESASSSVPAVVLNGSASKIRVSGGASVVSGYDGARHEISLKNGEQFTLAGAFTGDITLNSSELGKPFGTYEEGAQGFENLKCMGKPDALCIAEDGYLIWATEGDCYIGDNMYERVSLPEAVAKAPSGSTVYLINDVELSSTVTLDRIGASVTIASDGEMKKISIKLNGDEKLETASKRLFLIRNGHLTLENVILEGGMHKDYGGTVIVEEASCSLTLKGRTVLRGGKALNGGAVWVRRGTLKMEDDARIENCEAKNTGGAIYITNQGEAHILGGSIEENTAPQAGGIKAASGTGVYIGNGAVISGNKNGRGEESNICPEDKNTVVLNGTFTGRAGVSFGSEGVPFGLADGADGEYNIFSDSDSALSGFLSDGKMLWVRGRVKLEAEYDSGVIDDGGKKYGIIRFITNFDTAEDAPIVSYGTYVLTPEMFNENEEEIYNKGGEVLPAYFLGRTKDDAGWREPSSGYSFAVDYVKIPEEYFDTAFVAVSYVKIGETVVYKTLSGVRLDADRVIDNG